MKQITTVGELKQVLDGWPDDMGVVIAADDELIITGFNVSGDENGQFIQLEAEVTSHE